MDALMKGRTTFNKDHEVRNIGASFFLDIYITLRYDQIMKYRGAIYRTER